jgi:hypothetical protein
MRTGIQKAIWLHICREGGPWTPEEIAARFSISRQSANVTMQNMTTRGKHLRRFRVNKRTAFGVTLGCNVPLGVTLQEIWDSGIRLDAPDNSKAGAGALEETPA